jgi:hypothetical protein
LTTRKRINAVVADHPPNQYEKAPASITKMVRNIMKLDAAGS